MWDISNFLLTTLISWGPWMGLRNKYTLNVPCEKSPSLFQIATMAGFAASHTGVFIYQIYLLTSLHLLKSWRICPTLTMAVSDPWIFHAWVLHCISHSLTSLILPFWSFHSPIQLPNSRCTHILPLPHPILSHWSLTFSFQKGLQSSKAEARLYYSGRDKLWALCFWTEFSNWFPSSVHDLPVAKIWKKKGKI